MIIIAKQGEVIIRECLINDKRVKYDFCSYGNLDRAKKRYKNAIYKYIGSGSIVFLNGIEGKSKKFIHFFIKR